MGRDQLPGVSSEQIRALHLPARIAEHDGDHQLTDEHRRTADTLAAGRRPISATRQEQRYWSGAARANRRTSSPGCCAR